MPFTVAARTSPGRLRELRRLIETAIREGWSFERFKVTMRSGEE